MSKTVPVVMGVRSLKRLLGLLGDILRPLLVVRWDRKDPLQWMTILHVSTDSVNWICLRVHALQACHCMCMVRNGELG